MIDNSPLANWKGKKMELSDIIKKYIKDGFMIETEANMIREFYQLTHNKTQAIIFCEDMKRNYYGRTFGKLDSLAYDAINEEIAIYSCMSLIGEKRSYFDTLSDDYQQSILSLYADVPNEETLRERICGLLNIDINSALKKEKKQQEKQQKAAEKEEKATIEHTEPSADEHNTQQDDKPKEKPRKSPSSDKESRLSDRVDSKGRPIPLIGGSVLARLRMYQKQLAESVKNDGEEKN